jgi:hypothetical protein
MCWTLAADDEADGDAWFVRAGITLSSSACASGLLASTASAIDNAVNAGET